MSYKRLLGFSCASLGLAAYESLLIYFSLMDAASATKDYKLIIEVVRHGARAPSIIYDLALDPEDNFQIPMELTQLGADQHYKLGQHVKEKYFGGKVPNQSLVYAESTDKNRTK